MASASSEREEEPKRLAELLETGWRMLEEAESGGAETSSGAAAVQRKVQRGIALLERAACAVADLQLFSRNEDLEELPSTDLRFMLVPALLAALVLKQINPDKRLEHVQRARTSFMDFLRVCKDYEVAPFELPPPEPEDSDSPAGSSWSGPSSASDQAAFITMASNRQAKIERHDSNGFLNLMSRISEGLQPPKQACQGFEKKTRLTESNSGEITSRLKEKTQVTEQVPPKYKQKKELEKQLSSLKPFIESGQAEEEQIREFYLLQIKKWISISLEEIESIDQERAILNRRDALKQGLPKQPPRPPMKPFILTRDAAQAKVFGAGYPSLASMTVDDWYEQHRKQGVLPDQGISQKGVTEEQEEKKKTEEEEEGEGDEAAQKAREWDDWKDVHPRGYGNRKNMG